MGTNRQTYCGGACAYGYNRDALAACFRGYRRVMAHWRQSMPNAILDVAYSEWVQAPEATLRKVFAFRELEREPGRLGITRNVAPSVTLSAAQVREPPHSRGLGAWRRHEAHLAGLTSALCAPSAVRESR